MKKTSRQLWKIIQEAGDYLQGQLPDHPNHPKGQKSLCSRRNMREI